MPYTKQYTIRMRDTDAAGLIYFAEQLRIAHEAFEAFIDEVGLSFRYLLTTAPYMIPIVHTEADYRAPLFVGDKVTIHMVLDRIGTSSFTIQFHLTRHDNVAVGTVKTTHVAIDRESHTKVPVPEELRKHLEAIGP